MKRDEYKKGLWTVEEDRILADYVEVHGKGKWSRIPLATGAFRYAVSTIMSCRVMDERCFGFDAVVVGLKRSGKSSRLRWVNYLSPSVKRGDFSREEEDLIIRLHNLLGNRFFLGLETNICRMSIVWESLRLVLDGLGRSFRWSLIAGRLPGRTDNQVKNHWNSHLRKKLSSIHGSPGCKNHNAIGSCNNSSAKRSKAILMADSDPKPSSDRRAVDGENNASSLRGTVPATRRGGFEANKIGPSASGCLFGDRLGLANAPNLTGCLGDFEFDFILYGR